MVIKHLVDHYLIYYVYARSKINSSFHFTAISFVHILLIFLLYQMDFIFLEIRGQTKPFALIFVAILIRSLFLLLRDCKICCEDDDEKKLMYKITK